MAVVKKKRMCDECGHRHQPGVYCHMFVEVGDGDEDEDEEDEVEEDDAKQKAAKKGRNSDDSDDDMLGLVVPKSKENANIKRPLKTPPYVKSIKYTRCNCKLGVPNGSRIFEPVPSRVLIGDIHLKLYEDIIEAEEEAKRPKKSSLSYEAEQLLKAQIEEKKKYDFAAMIPYILSFTHLSQCCHSATVRLVTVVIYLSLFGIV